MSISSSEQSDRIGARLTHVANPRNGYPAAAPEFAPDVDRAEAYARLGDFDRAVEWLDRAATASGGLPPAYRAQRARWVRTTAVRPRQAGGYGKTRLAQAGAGAGR
jgi:hypothetical protein